MACRVKVLESCLATLHSLDPGNERQHRSILDSFGSETKQREFTREVLVSAIFARAASSVWSRVARFQDRTGKNHDDQ